MIMDSTMNESKGDLWLDLSEAARLLGVHFTTLRRWADSGKIPCTRTPGGRRRFRRSDLQALSIENKTQPGASTPREVDASILAHRQIHQQDMQKEQWMGQLGEVERIRFKYTGQMMLGLLMQYNSRIQGGEAFLNEAERVMGDYGVTCCKAGMSISDTTRAFLFFRRSITDMIFDTSALQEPFDDGAKRLFQRTNQFFDALLLSVLEGYCSSARTATPNSPQG
jgi:excisionase family DNA binding protein